MDKLQKFDYTQSIQQYLEDNTVYELFEGLLKQLIVQQPDNPLDFLINQLTNKQMKRIFLIGPPGSQRQENALNLAEYFQWKCISTGDLLRKEVNKKSDYGKAIAESFKKYEYVDDKIVIDLVHKEIQEFEKNNQDWIVQGFPRTKVQALSLQKMGIIPDQTILLNIKPSASLARIKTHLISANQALYGAELDDLASMRSDEYNLHIKGVKSAFKNFIYEHDAVDKAQNDVANDLARMLRIRYRANAPRRAPRVIILGPPGSGRTTQCEAISHMFGLVHVNTKQMLKDECNRNPSIGQVIQQAMDNDEPVPDEIVSSLVEQRLKQSDCRVNGWVLDGFPQSDKQINLLKAMKLKPSLVVILEQAEDECARRLGNSRLDPTTGTYYNLEINPPKDETTAGRLISLRENSATSISKRYKLWNAQLPALEEAYKNCLLNLQADKPVDQMTDQIQDNIQNPIF